MNVSGAQIAQSFAPMASSKCIAQKFKTMKKQTIQILLLFIVSIFSITCANAAYLKDIPKTLVQPNGDILHCYASGDEFYNYLHDKNGYTIIQNDEGYYMYAMYDGDNIIPSPFVAGTINPSEKGLQPNVTISSAEYQKRRATWFNYKDIPRAKTSERNHGTLNNLVVFIRFADETDITAPLTIFSNIFNKQTQGYNSMINYFHTTSYGHLTISSSFFPEPNGNLILSYQDDYPRSYYQPYNATTNPNGYQGGDNGWERTEREHALLHRAIDYIADMVPDDLDIDYDNDGHVDNVCFLIKGNNDDWANLLWPHRWALYNEKAYIHGKRVWDYNFLLEGGYFNNAVLCHEMQHSLSYPDFYHYEYGGSPCGNWDIMEANPNPPQQSGGYAKWKYGNWVDEPCEIPPGKFTLNSIGSGLGFVSYKIPTDDPEQFFIVEYRNSNDPFENFGNYGTVAGMLIYRIDTRWGGNAGYNNTNTFDEVFIFRPSANYPSNSGSLNLAHFGPGGRTTFDAMSDPKPTFSDGTVVTDCSLTNIKVNGGKISFTYNEGTTQFYGVAFLPNGGEGKMPPQMFEEEVEQELRINTFTFDDRLFEGWALTPKGEIVYEDNQSIAIDEDIVLYAIWSPAAPPVYYTITASKEFLWLLREEYGTIDPEGEVSVLESTDQSFVIQSHTDFIINYIWIDSNISIYPQNDEEKYRMVYTFKNVTDNHTIVACFISPYGVEEKQNNCLFSIHPNPATQYFEILVSPSDLNHNGIAVQIYDVQGLLLKRLPIYDEKTQIDISNLAKGFYIVKIGNEAKKLIIK